MKPHERIKKLRKDHLKLSQEEFASKINISRGNLSNIEINRVNVTDRTLLDICREFDVNEEWLKHGHGEIFRKFTEDEKVASYVYELLGDEGDNAFNTMIIEIMRTYNELESSSQEVIKESCKKLIENLGKKKEG